MDESREERIARIKRKYPRGISSWLFCQAPCGCLMIIDADAKVMAGTMQLSEECGHA